MNRLREMLESTAKGRRSLREARKRRDAMFAAYEQGYAAALRDAVEAVKALPSAWTDAAYREKAIAAIEALGGER